MATKKSLAEVVAEADVMPRATDKEVRAAKKKAESAARVSGMVTEMTAPKKRAGRRNVDPVVAAAPADEGAILAADPKFLANLDKDRAIRQATMFPGVVEGDMIEQVNKAKVAPALPATPYQGPMLALRERLKAGRYTKMANGQPANGDELAQVLGALEPPEVIAACLVALDLPTNPYLRLNIGQQSMNLRNKLRTALKKNVFGMGVVREAVEDQIEARPVPRETK